MTATLAPDAVEQLSTSFLSRVHGHLIDGGWVAPRSGKTFPVLNPATGEKLADVALGDALDVDDAVRAARRAFEGPWSMLSDRERARLLFDLADLMEARADELALVETL